MLEKEFWRRKLSCRLSDRTSRIGYYYALISLAVICLHAVIRDDNSQDLSIHDPMRKNTYILAVETSLVRRIWFKFYSEKNQIFSGCRKRNAADFVSLQFLVYNSLFFLNPWNWHISNLWTLFAEWPPTISRWVASCFYCDFYLRNCVILGLFLSFTLLERLEQVPTLTNSLDIAKPEGWKILIPTYSGPQHPLNGI